MTLLFQLKRKLVYNGYAQPVQLPRRGEETPSGHRVYVVGWGAQVVSNLHGFVEA